MLGKKYHKIQTLFKRDKKKKIIMWNYVSREIAYLSECVWDFYEKINGTNIRITWTGSNVLLGGRTDDADIPKPLLKHLNQRYVDNGKVFEHVFNNQVVTFYGEGCGPGINKGSQLYGGDYHFILFDINIGGYWLERHNVCDIANKTKMEIVPHIGTGTLLKAITMTREGFNSTYGDFIAEGIVAQPMVQMFNRMGQRIIVKIKHKDFRFVTDDEYNIRS